MAQFNLQDYETVEQRHARALEMWPDLRVVIENHTTPQDRAQGVWVVCCKVYKDTGDQAADLPKAVDWAFEVDGQGMANKTSALENAATSALGRALRWAFAGSKGASREEMEKVQRGVTPKRSVALVPDDVLQVIADASTLAELEQVWRDAVAGGYDVEVKAAVSKRKKALS